jgi:hypothetical protein
MGYNSLRRKNKTILTILLILSIYFFCVFIYFCTIINYNIKDEYEKICVPIIIKKKITTPGVVIPISKEIYRPVLKELKKLGIELKEHS